MELGEYDIWNEQKKRISQTSKNLSFKEREVWWCALGLNIGKESYGKGNAFRRPVLILKKLSSETSIVLPITSQKKTGSWFDSVFFK